MNRNKLMKLLGDNGLWIEKSSIEDVNNRVKEQKQRLIELAKSGVDRPHRSTKEGEQLKSYTNKSSRCYDPEFDKEVRNIRPDWFDRTYKQKQKLIELAKSGADKPSQKTKEGSQLNSYTTKGKCYDPVFDKEIRSIRPDWFINQSDIANENKKRLIELARSGVDRPYWKTKQGRWLNSYTTKSGNSYDVAFDKLIRELRPDWFMKTYKQKQRLIKLAKSGVDRPHRSTKEGQWLHDYICKAGDCYDPAFDKTIRALRPDWFKKK